MTGPGTYGDTPRTPRTPRTLRTLRGDVNANDGDDANGGDDGVPRGRTRALTVAAVGVVAVVGVDVATESAKGAGSTRSAGG
ncbi:hypothetical protein KDA82_39705, partial [Streptomyces daliensis]|nr:hypothetical protein [Streptomyces daliensis]